MGTSRERMPSSWYRYKEQKNQSIDMTSTTSPAYSQSATIDMMILSPTSITMNQKHNYIDEHNEGNKKPQKQNKKREKNTKTFGAIKKNKQKKKKKKKKKK